MNKLYIQNRFMDKHMHFKLSYRWLLLIILAIGLTACNSNSEIIIKRIDVDNPKVKMDQPISPSNLSLGNGIYKLEGIKSAKKFNLTLNYFSGGMIEELATTDSFSLGELEQVYFIINEGKVDILINDKNVIKNILHFKLESDLFPEENLCSWHWLEESKIASERGTVIFTYYSQEGSSLSTPELNDVDINEQISENKELNGIFIELKLDEEDSKE